MTRTNIDLSLLNDNQRLAVLQMQGPVVILAGAGSGKTRTMTYRIAYMIDSGISPANILAVTFTNKAAKEMKQRTISLIGDKERVPLMCTFHSLGVKIMREAGTKIGYRKNPEIADADDSAKRLRKIVKQMKLPKDMEKAFIDDVIKYISIMKDQLVFPEDLINKADLTEDEHLMVQVYMQYQAELFKDNVLDFDDLIAQPVKLFLTQPDVLSHYQNRFRYIMVDEYQDTSHAQFELIRLLSDKEHNICVVGDDYQSIYAFRGADISNILNFNKQYPEAMTITIGQNYRSTQTIVNAAAGVIAHNKKQMHKDLVSMQEMGEPIIIRAAESDRDEAHFVASTINRLMSNGARPSDFAVLYRKNFYSRTIEDAMLRSNLPYKIFGGTSFYQRAEIKDIVAYLKLISAENDVDSMAFHRVINVPKRGIGKAKLDKMEKLSKESGKNILEVALHDPSFKSVEGIVQFRTLLEDLRSAKNSLSLPDLIQKLIDDLEYEDYLQKSYKPGEENKTDKLDNVKELINKAQEYVCLHPDIQKQDILPEFLTEIALLTDQDTTKEADAVSLMTMHKSKGLEFPYVFMIGCEEGSFPHDVFGNESSFDVQEDRRLCYVAMTRAKKRLFISYANMRYEYKELKDKTPSRYLEEIPEQYVKYC